MDGVPVDRESEGVLPRQMALEELLLSAVLSKWALQADSATPSGQLCQTAGEAVAGTSGSPDNASINAARPKQDYRPKEASAKDEWTDTSASEALDQQAHGRKEEDMDGCTGNVIDKEEQSYLQADDTVKSEGISGSTGENLKESSKSSQVDKPVDISKKRNVDDADDDDDDEADLDDNGVEGMEAANHNGRNNEDHDNRDSDGAAGGSTGTGSRSSSGEGYHEASSGDTNKDSGGGGEQRQRQRQSGGSGEDELSDVKSPCVVEGLIGDVVSEGLPCDIALPCGPVSAATDLPLNPVMHANDEVVAAAAAITAAAVVSVAATSVVTALAVVAATTASESFFVKSDPLLCPNYKLHALCGGTEMIHGASVDQSKLGLVGQAGVGVLDCGGVSTSVAAAARASLWGEDMRSAETLSSPTGEYIACGGIRGSSVSSSSSSVINDEIHGVSTHNSSEDKNAVCTKFVFDVNEPTRYKFMGQRRNSFSEFAVSGLSVQPSLLSYTSGISCKFSWSAPDLSLIESETSSRVGNECMWCPAMNRCDNIFTGSRSPSARFPVKLRTASYECRVIEYCPPRFVESRRAPQLSGSAAVADVRLCDGGSCVEGYTAPVWCLDSSEATVTICGYVLTETSAASNSPLKVLLGSVSRIVAMGAGRLRIVYGDRPYDQHDRTYELPSHARKAFVKHLKSLLPAAKLHLKVQNAVTCQHCQRSLSSCLRVRVPEYTGGLCPDCGWSMEGLPTDLVAINEVLNQRQKQKTIIADFGFRNYTQPGSQPEETSVNSSSKDATQSDNNTLGCSTSSDCREASSDTSSPSSSPNSSCCPSHDYGLLSVNPAASLLARLLADRDLARIPPTLIYTSVNIISGAPPCPYAVKAGDFAPGVSRGGILLQRSRPCPSYSQSYDCGRIKSTEEQVIDLVRLKITEYAKQKTNPGSKDRLKSIATDASKNRACVKRTGAVNISHQRKANISATTRPPSGQMDYCSYPPFPGSCSDSSRWVTDDSLRIGAALAAFTTPREYFLSYKEEEKRVQALHCELPAPELGRKNRPKNNLHPTKNSTASSQTPEVVAPKCGRSYNALPSAAKLSSSDAKGVAAVTCLDRLVSRSVPGVMAVMTAAAAGPRLVL